jgi:hypothetical protein
MDSQYRIETIGKPFMQGKEELVRVLGLGEKLTLDAISHCSVLPCYDFEITEKHHHDFCAERKTHNERYGLFGGWLYLRSGIQVDGETYHLSVHVFKSQFAKVIDVYYRGLLIRNGIPTAILDTAYLTCSKLVQWQRSLQKEGA